jgi:hypothetical protein
MLQLARQNNCQKERLPRAFAGVLLVFGTAFGEFRFEFHNLILGLEEAVEVVLTLRRHVLIRLSRNGARLFRDVVVRHPPNTRAASEREDKNGRNR